MNRTIRGAVLALVVVTMAVGCNRGSTTETANAAPRVAFVHDYFTLPDAVASDYVSDTSVSTAEHIDRHYQTNVRGLILCTVEGLKMLPKGGCVINVSSNITRMAIPGTSVAATRPAPAPSSARRFRNTLSGVA